MPAGNTEALGIYGGAFNDTFQDLRERAPASSRSFLGRAESDTYTVGGILSATMQIINSPLRIHGEGGGTDAIQLPKRRGHHGRTFHIAQDAIGSSGRG
jgi:hypothetical protein